MNIKKEFLKFDTLSKPTPTEFIPTKHDTLDDTLESSGRGRDNSHKKQRGNGKPKAKGRAQYSLDSINLCNRFDNCQRGDSCKFSHDVGAYLKVKGKNENNCY